MIIKKSGGSVKHEIILPKPMLRANYYANAMFGSGSGDNTIDIGFALSKTTLSLYPTWTSSGQYIFWIVEGLSA